MKTGTFWKLNWAYDKAPLRALGIYYIHYDAPYFNCDILFGKARIHLFWGGE